MPDRTRHNPKTGETRSFLATLQETRGKLLRRREIRQYSTTSHL